MKKLAPLFARVLLERPQFENKGGSIIVPEMARKKYASLKCRVVAIGPDAFVDTKSNVNVGDEVIIGRYAGAWLKADGNPTEDESDAQYFIVQDEDILVRCDAE